GEKPEKPFSGKFVVRLSPELHGRLSIAAKRSKKSLNAWVTEQLERAAG
ncbi:MAG: toxin-antitoxin system HicB family antitoxin, partial [Gammaproteobacteria bacterium]|nr:toxin-antitoxin system HicB family antitoxin [Gammaproteobacteria bacterium]